MDIQRWRLSLMLGLGFAMNSPALATAADLTHVSRTGAVFTSDKTRPELGDAYRDQHGLIWGDIATYKGQVWKMSEYDGEKYCAQLHARLPTKQEFKQFSIDLGSGAQSYSPFTADGKTQVIPNLVGYWFWSSTIFPFNSDNAYAFGGEQGYQDQMSFTGYVFRESYNGGVRCVADAWPLKSEMSRGITPAP